MHRQNNDTDPHKNFGKLLRIVAEIKNVWPLVGDTVFFVASSLLSNLMRFLGKQSAFAALVRT
jgi:hypothetical protein